MRRNLIVLLLAAFGYVAEAQSFFHKPATPLYSTLSNVKLIMDATGLRDNTNNGYGTVSSGVVQEWQSIAPGDATMTFDAAPVGGTGGPWFSHVNTLKFQDGYIEFPGYVLLGATQSTLTNYNFISYNATFANLKWTVHMVLKLAKNNNGWIYGLFGSSAGSAGNKGAAVFYEDRPSVSRSDGLSSNISKGSAGFILSAAPDDLITPDVPFVLTIETDNSLTTADRQKYFINGVQFAHTVTSASSAVSSGQTYTFEIGAIGNDALPFRGWMSHFILQSGVETAGVRNAFIASLLPYKNKTNSDYFYNVDESRTYSVSTTLATAGRYYFVQGLLQSPTDPNKIIKIYHEGNAHLHDNDKKVAQEISTDKGRTFAAATTTYDEDGAGTYAVQDGEWGYSDDGRLHGITDWHTSVGTPGGSHKLLYHYSDNDGASYTTVDISSVIPSDGLTGFRAHGNIIENNGYIYACLYKATDEGDATQSAQYILRKPTGSSITWTAFTVRAVGSDYRNEMAIAALDANTLMIISRDEATAEWRQYTGTSDGTSWTDNGALTVGETLTIAAPPMLSSFYVSTANNKNIKVIGLWTLNKTTAEVKVTYGVASALAASNVSGWDTDTKRVIVDDTQMVHYGRVCHYNNTINAIGAFAREPSPFTGTENTLITFQCPATQYYDMRTELGL